MQSDWLRIFWPISQEQKFSQKWDLCRNTADNINVHYRTNSVKIDDQTYQKIKKKQFGPFSKFWRRKSFTENPALSHTTSYEVLAPYQNLEKPNDKIPIKRPDRKAEGRTKEWTDCIS